MLSTRTNSRADQPAQACCNPARAFTTVNAGAASALASFTKTRDEYLSSSPAWNPLDGWRHTPSANSTERGTPGSLLPDATGTDGVPEANASVNRASSPV